MANADMNNELLMVIYKKKSPLLQSSGLNLYKGLLTQIRFKRFRA